MTQHSRILASDFSLPSDEGIVDVLSSNNDSLAKLGAHHMVVYSGLHDPRRVFATLGLHDRGSIDKLLRNPAVMDWFDAAGVEEHEVCPVFRATLHGDPAPEEDEVAEWCWVGVAELTAALAAVPRAFSPWLVAQWEQGAFDAG